jgi:hypothetical protein
MTHVIIAFVLDEKTGACEIFKGKKLAHLSCSYLPTAAAASEALGNCLWPPRDKL